MSQKRSRAEEESGAGSSGRPDRRAGAGAGSSAPPNKRRRQEQKQQPSASVPGPSKSSGRVKKVEKEDEEPESEAEAEAGPSSSILEQTSLDLSSHPLPPYAALSSTLARFSHLRKLNLSAMEPSEQHADGLDSLRWLGQAALAARKQSRRGDGKRKADEAEDEWFGKELTTLNLSGNHGLGKAIEGIQAGVPSPLGGLEAFPNLYCESDGGGHRDWCLPDAPVD